MERIPVYFVPGLASSPRIFEYIKLPQDKFEMHMIDWIIPDKGESLQHYCRRLSVVIKHPDPVLVGVSMGGIIVQEMGAMVGARKVIIISSVKCNTEFPKRMWFARNTRLYKLFPTRLMQHLDKVKMIFPRNNKIRRRLELYEKFLGVRDKKYLDWSFKNILEWKRAVPDESVIHIHGTDDAVFPARYIKNFIPVKGGTHIMIIDRFGWMNEHLPRIISENEVFKK